MIAIITEKPSVAQTIAKVLNINTRKEGCYVDNKYMITWAIGHLVSLALPEDYGFHRPVASELPILPDPFQFTMRKNKTMKGYVVDSGIAKQMRIIEKVFDECKSIIVATDAGREGELIFRLIYNYLGCTKPFKRLWISSLTDRAIQKGFDNLEEGEKYNNLYYAADCRSKADWLIGINSSRALGVASGIMNNSLGRVQTPTLAMICARYLEHRSHQTTHYWQHAISLQKNGICQNFTSDKKYENEKEAESIYEHLKTYSSAKILSYEKKETSQQPPLLYDLTALQKDANRYHSLTANDTLQILQDLYEKKLVSYPRTSSAYIPEDVFVGIRPLLEFVGRMKSFSHYAPTLQGMELNKRSVDDKKVTDHHALIITGVKPEVITNQELLVYCMIAGRMLEAFSPKCIKETLSVSVCCDDMEFASNISRVLSPGWRNVLKRQEDKEDDENHDNDVFPEYSENEIVGISSHNLMKRKTLPRPLFTEATLLSAMESCGKNLEDEVQRQALKECGIGTPATRAAIIETLFARGYVERSGKSLTPTEKGLYIYSVVKNMRIADVAMTGEWENSLGQIEKGDFYPDTFMKAVKILTEQITREILSAKIGCMGGRSIACPKCGTGSIMFTSKVARCNNDSCKLVVFRNILNKTLTDQHLEQLISSGKTKLIKGFKGKKEKSFDAYLIFDKEFSVTFDFPSRKGNNRKK